MSAEGRPRVLCVDDEPRVVEALALNLRKDYEVITALSGDEALLRLREHNGAAVVVSDMRMPGMDGATLLQRVRRDHPHATRILLTGEPGRDVGVLAVNKGQIFRYLTKPCSAQELRSAIEAGVIQYRLLNAEQAVLQETLLGFIAALIDLLAVTNPVAFGRASRVQQLAIEFSSTVGCTDFWQLEAAAMLSQMGYISLPADLVEKIYRGERLTAAEGILAAPVAKFATQLLDHVPRLEPVMEILTAQSWSDDQINRLGDGSTGLATRILGLTIEFDTLVSSGSTADVAVQTLRGRSSRFGAQLIEQFAQHLGARAGAGEVRELSLGSVLRGMTILEDVRTHTGTLLVPRGFEVTDRFLQRIGNFGLDLLEEKVRVLVPGADSP